MYGDTSHTILERAANTIRSNAEHNKAFDVTTLLTSPLDATIDKHNTIHANRQGIHGWRNTCCNETTAATITVADYLNNPNTTICTLCHAHQLLHFSPNNRAIQHLAEILELTKPDATWKRTTSAIALQRTLTSIRHLINATPAASQWNPHIEPLLQAATEQLAHQTTHIDQRQAERLHTKLDRQIQKKVGGHADAILDNTPTIIAIAGKPKTTTDAYAAVKAAYAIRDEPGLCIMAGPAYLLHWLYGDRIGRTSTIRITSTPDNSGNEHTRALCAQLWDPTSKSPARDIHATYQMAAAITNTTTSD